MYLSRFQGSRNHLKQDFMTVEKHKIFFRYLICFANVTVVYVTVVYVTVVYVTVAYFAVVYVIVVYITVAYVTVV